MLFPVLEIEPDLQAADKTRLKAIKSFISKGEVPLTTVKIKPGADETDYDVFSTDQEDWWLDWAYFDWKADLTSANNKIEFVEVSTSLTATIPVLTYTFSALLTAIKTSLEAVGSGTYTVTADSHNIITIQSTLSFSLKGEASAASALSFLGFSKNTDSAIKHVGKPVEWLPREVTLTIDNATTPKSVSTLFKLYSVEGDRLFSEDGDLVKHESDILSYVESGRSTFLNTHRKAQDLILKWIDKQGYVDIFRNKFDKWSISDLEEVNEWSTFMVLKLIMENVSNATDDVFSRKRNYYSGLEKDARQRLVLRIDTDGDGKVDNDEHLRISTGELYRQ
jgi:hypothetical protein